MTIRNPYHSGASRVLNGRRPEGPADDGPSLASLGDFFSGALPVGGLFSHVENMESLVSYPKGDAVYLRKGRATLETCQAGFQANLGGTVAVAGAGVLSALGLAAAAWPVAGVGLAALMVSGATNAFTRQEIGGCGQG